MRSKPLEERKKKSEELMTKNTGRYPVILEKAERSKMSDLKKVKLVVPKNFKISHLTNMIKTESGLKEDQSLHLSINKTMLLPSTLP